MISSSLISLFITLERCDLRPTPAFHPGYNKSFIVMGDLFFSRNTYLGQLVKEYWIVREIRTPKRGFEQYSLLVMSKNSDQT
jgi:hypothetical protein